MSRATMNAIAKSVLWGGFAGAAPFLLFSVPFGLSLFVERKIEIGHFTVFWGMVFPLVAAWLGTLIGALVIGLPVTMLLASSGLERGRFYILAGLIGGSLPFLRAGQWSDTVWLMAFSIPGGLAGAVAGWHWGRHRDAVIAARGSAA
ncbi:MAG: hypothetical protein ACK4YM_05640 [Novosphingobium sp.]